MPETISTQNLETLPITSQELVRGPFLPPPPTIIGLSNSPTIIGLSENPFVCKKNPSKFRMNPFVLKKSHTLSNE